MMTAVYRYASQYIEKNVHREDKPFFLNQELGIFAYRIIKQLPHNKIPVARVGSYANHTFREILFPREQLPPIPLQKFPAAPLHHACSSFFSWCNFNNSSAIAMNSVLTSS